MAHFLEGKGFKNINLNLEINLGTGLNSGKATVSFANDDEAYDFLSKVDESELFE